jgi:hypothetical protein
MEQPLPPDDATWPFPFPRQDWAQTPPAVQAYLRTVQQDLAQLQDLQERVAVLEARLQQDSTTSQRPPLLGQPVQEEAPALDALYHPQSGRATRICGAPPSPVAADRRARAVSRAVCLWPHRICHDHTLPDAPGA